MNNVDIKDYAAYVGITMLMKGLTVSPLKLQKILYYEQAWHMVGLVVTTSCSLVRHKLG